MKRRNIIFALIGLAAAATAVPVRAAGSEADATGRDERAMRERVEQILEDFVDFGGYVRAGYGRDGQGGPQVAFKAPGAATKYRLGNEAENYLELALGRNWYPEGAFSLDPEKREGVRTGPIARLQVRMSAYNPFESQLSASATDIAFPESWASIGNVVSSQPEMKFWAGNRFYRRHQIHISDFFFYNMSGGGGGVEDIDLRPGKLAVAWIGWNGRSGISSVPEPDPENKAGFSKENWDLRLYDVDLPWGRGEFGLTYAITTSGLDALGNVAPRTHGLAVNFVHTHDRFISDDGVNEFSLQYGRGPALTFTAGFETFELAGASFIRPDGSDSWRFRMTENFTANLSEHFSLGPAFVYEVSDYGELRGKVVWASAGVRPIYHFSEYVSLAFEGGLDWVSDHGKDTEGSLVKLTVAPQISLGRRFMSRPVFRAFVTYAKWSPDFVGRVGGLDYLNDDEGWTGGVQMEAWW